MRVKRGNEESRIQQACVTWFRYQFPRLVMFAVPNGGYRNAVTGAVLKAEGVLAGVSDLILLHPSGGYHGLCIEMKTPRGRQAETQKAFQKRVEGVGYKYALVRSFEEFQSVVIEYLSMDLRREEDGEN